MADPFATSDRIGIDLTRVDTVQQHPLGGVVRGYSATAAAEGEFIYLQYGATITVGQIGIIDLSNKVALASSTSHANSGKPVAFAVAATGADTNFGWFQISGKVKAKAGTVAADAKVMLTTTAGTIDDAAIAGSQVIGAEYATADGTPAAGFAYVNANRPAIQSQIT